MKYNPACCGKRHPQWAIFVSFQLERLVLPVFPLTHGYDTIPIYNKLIISPLDIVLLYKKIILYVGDIILLYIGIIS